MCHQSNIQCEVIRSHCNKVSDVCAPKYAHKTIQTHFDFDFSLVSSVVTFLTVIAIDRLRQQRTVDQWHGCISIG